MNGRAMGAPPAALFKQVAPDVMVATDYSRGPWDDRHCHGGPVAALLARAVERFDDGHPDDHWQTARLTVELTRPVPVGVELVLTTELERGGRSVSLVAARLADGDTVVAHVRALRIRRDDIDLVDPVDADDPIPARGDQSTVIGWDLPTDDTIRFHSHGCEHRIVAGGMDVPGPATDWIRLAVPLFEGESPSGVQRAAAAADFGNGISSGLSSDAVAFINPDLTVHLARPPIGEWIALASSTHYALAANEAMAFAESALYDEHGRIGRSVQSLILAPR